MKVKAKTNLKGAKTIKFAGLKVSATKPDAVQLEKINQLTRRPFTADELYVGQLRLANNCIDRDNERFSEEVLQRFADTAVRKTMLFDHNRQSQGSAIGKFYDVEIEKMPLVQAIAETGEELTLPDGATEVQFLSPSFFIPINGVDEKVIVKIDASIYDFSSIGFRCENLIPVFDQQGEVLFWEYRGMGPCTEMTEGSLVYLGAQYGMAVKDAQGKKAGESESALAEEGIDIDGKNKGGTAMKGLLKVVAKLFPGKSFTEEGIADEVKDAIEEFKQKAKQALDDAVAPLKVKIAELEPLVAQVKELKPLAEEGKAYRADLCQKYAASKLKLGDIDEKPETMTETIKIAGGFGIDFLKAELVVLERRVTEKFPSRSEMPGDDPNADKSKEAGKEENALIPKD